MVTYRGDNWDIHQSYITLRIKSNGIKTWRSRDMSPLSNANERDYETIYKGNESVVENVVAETSCFNNVAIYA